jgi:hypothetical protein
MTPIRLSAAALLAAVFAGAGAYDGTLQTPSAPCAPVVGKRPSPPASLRIIGEMLRLPRVWIDPASADDEYASGPHAAPDGAAMVLDPNSYFDDLSVRSDCMVAYSLRDMNQLLAFMDQSNPSIKPWDITYDPTHDPDPRRQDAAKVVIPANEPSLPNNVRLPIPDVGSGSLFVTWDSWMGREFAYASTGIGNYKHFQFTSPDRIWTEVKSDFNLAVPGSVAMVQVRAYAQMGSGLLGPNVTNEQPLSPMASEFAVLPEKWTRYWAYFNPVGEWYEFSLWLADASRGPVLVLDRRQIKPNYPLGATGWQSFWLEYNTSAHGWDTGFPARVGYARNVVMLRGVTPSAIPNLLQRPLN